MNLSPLSHRARFVLMTLAAAAAWLALYEWNHRPVRGVVRDAQGRAMPGVYVLAEYYRSNASTWFGHSGSSYCVATAGRYTDGRGRYSFPHRDGATPLVRIAAVDFVERLAAWRPGGRTHQLSPRGASDRGPRVVVCDKAAWKDDIEANVVYLSIAYESERKHGTRETVERANSALSTLQSRAQ